MTQRLPPNRTPPPPHLPSLVSCNLDSRSDHSPGTSTFQLGLHPNGTGRRPTTSSTLWGRRLEHSLWNSLGPSAHTPPQDLSSFGCAERAMVACIHTSWRATRTSRRTLPHTLHLPTMPFYLRLMSPNAFRKTTPSTYLWAGLRQGLVKYLHANTLTLSGGHTTYTATAVCPLYHERTRVGQQLCMPVGMDRRRALMPGLQYLMVVHHSKVHHAPLPRTTTWTTCSTTITDNSAW